MGFVESLLARKPNTYLRLKPAGHLPVVTCLITFPLTQVIFLVETGFVTAFVGVGDGEALAAGVAVDSGFFIETLIAGFE